MNDRKRIIPRKIWLLWYQGRSEAPLIVRVCMDSWIKENPGWEVAILDKNNLSQYITLALPEEKLASLPFEKQSNLVRLQLLSDYGGVWADATTLCMKPLDDWIDDRAASGFFAFDRPGPDRLISNWFMACEKGCPIVLKLKERYVSFFMRNDFNMSGSWSGPVINFLGRYFNRSEKTTRHWFSPVVTKLLRVYPYFVFHYLFERLVSGDPESRKIWDNTKKISSDGPHRMQAAGLFSPLNETIKKEIDGRSSPLYKLTWKFDPGKLPSASVLSYLLDGRHRSSGKDLL